MWKTCYHKKKFSKEKALRSDKKRGTWETRKLTKIPRPFFLQATEIILSCIKVSNVTRESRKNKKIQESSNWVRDPLKSSLIGARASVLHWGRRNLFHKRHNWDGTNRRLFFDEICLPDRREITNAAFFVVRSYSVTLPRKIILNE